MPRVFTDGEMRRRVSQLRESMDRAGIDCVLATSVHNVMYLSGFFLGMPFGRICMAIIPLKGEPSLVVWSAEADHARAFTWFEDVREYTDHESPTDAATRITREVLAEQGLAEGRIGVEEDVLPVGLWKAFANALPKATLIDIEEPLERQRQIKSPEEIELSRQLARTCEATLRALEAATHEGLTEIEIAYRAEEAAYQEHLRRFPDFEHTAGTAWFFSGPRIWGHNGPDARKVQRGDLIRVTAVPTVMGYFSTLTRRRVMGEVTDALKRPYDLCLEAQTRCIEAIKPGVKFSEIDRVALGVFEKAGMAEHKGFGSGHSHGLMGPFWGREKRGEYRPYNDTLLQEGMITSMEPSLHVPDVGGFNVNDMVLVTRDGAEVLTNYPRDMTSIG